jgi:O-antigen ligase
MSRTLEYLSPLELIKGTTREIIATIALLTFMLSDGIYYVFEVILPASFIQAHVDRAILNVWFFVLLLIYYSLQFMVGGKKTTVWPIFFLIAVVIVSALFFHPEYKEWFNHSYYGIISNFLDLSKGLYALLFFSMFRDRKRMVGTVVLAGVLNFFLYVVMFIFATRRGYWGVINGKGVVIHASYNLTFGYNVAFCCVMGMLMYAFGKRKTWILLYTGASFLMLVFAGSRGALLCIITALVLIILTKVRSPKNQNYRRTLTSVLLVLLMLIFVVGLPTILSFLLSVLSRMNISGSRTIKMLLSGNMMASNGRDQIWRIAKRMIAEGRVFGLGFYGDRYVIGQSWSYGYPHNIYYELAIEFGVAAAIIVLTIILVNCLKLWHNCEETEWLFMFILMLSCSMKLLISDSFWYNQHFWALIAILCCWAQSHRHQFGKIYIKRARRM